MQALVAFHFPISWVSHKSEKTQQFSENDKEDVESVINGYLNGKESQNIARTKSQFCKFLEVLARNHEWRMSSPESTRLVMRAVSYCYLTSQIPDLINTIKKIVKNCAHELSPYIPNDVQLKFKERNHLVSCSSLFLSCNSEYFWTFFSHSFKEGALVKEAYKNEATSLPELEYEGCSLESLHNFIHFLETGSLREEACENVDDLHKFSDFALITDKSFVEQVKIQTLNANHQLAAEFYQYSCEKHLDKLKRVAMTVLLGHLSTDQAFQRNNRAIPAYIAFNEQDIQKYCFDRLIDELPKWYETLEHSWNPQKKSFVGLSKKAKHLVAKLFKRKQIFYETEQAQRSIRRFCALRSRIESVEGNSLSKLNDKERNWFLDLLSSKATSLSFDQCQFESIPKALKKFARLETLSLERCIQLVSISGIESCRSLKHLSFKGSFNLIDMDSLKGLPIEFLSLEGCSNILLDFTPIKSLPLKEVNVKGCPIGVQKAIQSWFPIDVKIISDLNS